MSSITPSLRIINQPLLKKIKQLCALNGQLYQTTGFIGMTGDNQVMWSHSQLTDLAPLSAWIFNSPFDSKDYHYQHTIVLDGVHFVSITAVPIEMPAEESNHE